MIMGPSAHSSTFHIQGLEVKEPDLRRINVQRAGTRSYSSEFKSRSKLNLVAGSRFELLIYGL